MTTMRPSIAFFLSNSCPKPRRPVTCRQVFYGIRIAALTLILALVLTGCNSAPTPTVQVIFVTATPNPAPQVTLIVVTATPLPATDTPLPTATHTPEPTATHTPEPTFVPLEEGVKGLGHLAYVTGDGNLADIVAEVPAQSEAGSQIITKDDFEDMDPAWSADGEFLAFASKRDGNFEVYVTDPIGEYLQRITMDPGHDGGPAWSNDMEIAFHTNRDGNFEIYTTGSGVHRNLTKNPADDAYPAWSPDGQHIAFHSNRDGNWEICVMDADGANQKRLTNDPAHDWVPAWSPNGDLIAFWSKRTGHWQVFVMNPDGSDVRQVSQEGLYPDPTGISRPAWSPDGKYIAYNCVRDNSDEICVLDVRRALEFGPTDQVMRLTTDNFTPDYDPTWGK